VIADSQRRGVDVVFRMHQTRKADFRRGRRLGPGGHIVTWPKSPRPDWMRPADYAAMPKELRLREIRGPFGLPAARRDGGGCLGPWSAFQHAATKVGVLNRS
jgi:hypothetical protein